MGHRAALATERQRKEENLEMKGTEKERMWVVGGTAKEEEEKDREGERKREFLWEGSQFS